MEAKYAIREEVLLVSVQVDGSADPKGRVVGKHVTLERYTYRCQNASLSYGFYIFEVPSPAPAKVVRYCVRVQTTRDGRRFGAYRSGKVYDTEAEARTIFEKRVKYAEKNV